MTSDGTSDGTTGGPRDAGGEPLTNSGIVEAMRNVSVDDTTQTRALLFQLLLESTLVVATPDAPEVETSRIAGEGESISLITSSDDEGTVLPVFTSVATMLEWRPEGGGYAALPARALCEMAVANGTPKIAIDPGSPVHGFLTAWEMKALAQGRLPLDSGEVMAEATPVLVGQPSSPPPDDVIQAVVDALAAEPRAEAAWLFLMQQGDGRPELMIGVRFSAEVTPAIEPTVMRGIVDAAGNRNEGVRQLAFMQPDADFAQRLAEGTGREIYRRT